QGIGQGPGLKAAHSIVCIQGHECLCSLRHAPFGGLEMGSMKGRVWPQVQGFERDVVACGLLTKWEDG
ncbi:MAG: hypothetical protein ABSG51_11855, partial [Terracidiphilus sp.]